MIKKQSIIFVYDIQQEWMVQEMENERREREKKIIFHMYKSLFLTALMLLPMVMGASCPENCADCDPTGTICFACHEGMQANVFGGCHQNTVDRCIIYGPTSECFNCQPTYKLTTNACEKDYTGCVLSNTNDGTCFQCGFSTSLHGAHCSGVINCKQPSAQCSQCRDGYELKNNVCRDVSEGCKEVRDADGICGVCKKGYEFVGFQCIPKKVRVPRCYIYNAEGKCLVCKNGYNIFQFRCLLSIQIQQYMMAQAQGLHEDFGFTEKGFVQGGKQIQIAYMKKLEIEFLKEIGQVQEEKNTESSLVPEEQTLKPADITTNSENSVTIEEVEIKDEPKPLPPPPHCQVPNPENPGICLICQYGYFPKNSLCQQVSPLCKGHNVETGQCFDCKYGLTLENGACIDKNCAVSEEYKCLQCHPGFKTDQNQVCKYSDPNCLQSFNSRCEKCKADFYADLEGKCVPLPPNCKFANFQTGQCLQCKPGFNKNPQLGTCDNIPVIQHCQVPNPENPSICLICEYGWYPSVSQCLKVSDLCGQHNVQNGACLSCKNHYLALEAGKCIDKNCQTYDHQTCISCKKNHKFNVNKGVCEFADLNCQKSVDGSCIVCKPGFYINEQKTCTPLPPNCQFATPSGQCSQCLSGFQAGNGKCVKILVIENCVQVDSVNKKCAFCNDRFYTAGNVCAPVPNECGSYDPMNGQCYSCKVGYYPSSGKCIPKPIKKQPKPQQKKQQPKQYPKQQPHQQEAEEEKIDDANCRESKNKKCVLCSKRYYPNEQGKCVPVNPLCRDHNNQGQCTQCYQGYTVKEGRCVIAVVSDPNCKSFSGSVCSTCYKGFYFHSYEQICKRINPLCKSSNSQTGACTSCYPGYNLNANSGACEVFFRDPNCKNFNTENKCTLCANRYYIHASGKCSPVSPLCKEYNGENGKCTGCYPGYVVSKGTCILGNAKDPNCKTFSSDSQCTQCFRGFFVKDGECKKANPLCRGFNPANGDCTDCFPGYTLNQGKCIEGSSQDVNCKKHNTQNQCVECYQGFIAVQGKCQQQNPLCKTINKTNGECKSCWPGFSLISGDCVVKTQQTSTSSSGVDDVYCIKIKDGKCIECANGYYYNKAEQFCKQVDTLCKDYNVDNGLCTDCFRGFELVGGKCQTASVVVIPYCLSTMGGVCTQCMQSYYLSEGTCKAVSILCASYDRTNGQCTSCVTGHHLQDGQCIFPALFDARCEWYESAYCIRCQSGFYISSYTCHPVDANCSRFNQNHIECEECVNGLSPFGAECI